MNKFLQILLITLLISPLYAFGQSGEVADYNRFKSNPTVEGGIEFLTSHPGGYYYDTVSDSVSRMLSDRLNEFSIESDYNEALKYAKSKQAKRYVEDRISEARKAQKRYMKEYDSRQYASATGSEVTDSSGKSKRIKTGLFAIGGSFLMDYASKQYGIGGMLNLRLGSPNFIVNGVVGLRYMGTSLSDSAGEDQYTYNQLSVPAVLRFNFPGILGSGIYLGAGAAYNNNLSVSYNESLSDTSPEQTHGSINKSTYSVLGQVGIGGKTIDGNIFVQYDLKPVVAGEKKMFRVGFEIAWYFLRF